MKVNIHNNKNGMSIELDANGNKYPLPALWIRERAQEESQVDLKTKQRLFNPHLLDPNLAIVSASEASGVLNISFSDGYTGDYDIGTLTEDVFHFQSGLPEIVAWKTAGEKNDRYDWQQIISDKQVYLNSLETFLKYGYIIVTNTPIELSSIEDVANHYGYIRDTNFGKVFEVKSKPNADDLAYTPFAIGPHTDNPYRDPVPGIQLLHCLINETSGGLSTLVDSLSVSKQLKAEDPEGFELLASTVVRYRYYDSGKTELVSYRPIIDRDNFGNVSGIQYSPRLDDLPLLPEQTLQHFQRARKRLTELFEDANYEKKFKLESGELMMFDNNRVLHGRTSFDVNEGRRHLQGCYIDRDAPKSNYRVLSKLLK